MTSATEISLQLYSIRTLLEEDLAGSLALVAQTGFTSVELYNMVAWSEGLRRELAASGLKAPTAHARLLGRNQEEIFTIAADLGVTTIIDPLIDQERWSTASDIDRVADELAETADLARDYGLELGYHNHNWEAENQIEGQTALEYLASRLPESIHLEVDVYWAAIGGADVPALLGRLGDRVRFLHVKDAPLGDDGRIHRDVMEQVPVGEGSLPWQQIFAAAPAAEMYVVEFDFFRGDVLDAAARSLSALTKQVSL